MPRVMVNSAGSALEMRLLDLCKAVTQALQG